MRNGSSSLADWKSIQMFSANSTQAVPSKWFHFHVLSLNDRYPNHLVIFIIFVFVIFLKDFKSMVTILYLSTTFICAALFQFELFIMGNLEFFKLSKFDFPKHQKLKTSKIFEITRCDNRSSNFYPKNVDKITGLFIGKYIIF